MHNLIKYFFSECWIICQHDQLTKNDLTHISFNLKDDSQRVLYKLTNKRDTHQVIWNILCECLYLLAVSIASWLRGGTVKHTDGTMASFPVGLMIFHFVLCELSSNTHSSPLLTVI